MKEMKELSDWQKNKVFLKLSTSFKWDYDQGYQKSTQFPFTYQSPDRVGSGPLGLKPYSGYIPFNCFF